MAGARHHGMTIEACERPPRMDLAMPERFVVTIQAGAIRLLDRLSAIDAKLDKPAHPEPAPEHRVIASRPVASFASQVLDRSLRADLEAPSHFCMDELLGEIEVARVAVGAADIFGF